MLAMDSPRLIKKYPNRRLYDTEESRYVTLDDIKALVMDSSPFKVVDNQTEEDITRMILLQIIMEQESSGKPLFSADVLGRFIRFYGDSTQAAFTGFLEQSLDFFLTQQRQLSGQLQSLWSQNPVDFWLKVSERNIALFKDMENALKPTDKHTTKP